MLPAPPATSVQPTEPTQPRVGVCTDARMYNHSEPNKATQSFMEKHDESPERLPALIKGIDCAISEQPTDRHPIKFGPREMSDDMMICLHGAEHLKWMRGITGDTPLQDLDMYANDHTSTAIMAAAGCALQSALAISSGVLDRAYAVVRPPGHHAQPYKATGFCFVNNALLAAVTLAVRDPSAKIALLDIDVHYHLGTRLCLERVASENPEVASRILIVSMHRYDNGTFYPFHAQQSETEIAQGTTGWHPPYCYNVAFDGPISDQAFRNAFYTYVVPFMRSFKTTHVVGSYGYDAAIGDPLGGCEVAPATYGEITSHIRTTMTDKLLVVQEGGYNLSTIEQCAYHVMKSLM